MSRWKGRIEKLDTEAGRNQTITLSIDGDLRETYDALKDTDVSVEIKSIMQNGRWTRTGIVGC